MSILFELGSGQGAALCVEKKQIVCGPVIGYRYSNAMQCHVLNIGTIVISWRLRRLKPVRRSDRHIEPFVLKEIRLKNGPRDVTTRTFAPSYIKPKSSETGEAP